jgi:1-acyl-sn-glycerol-3-phosphate acyltransferase
MAYAQRTFRVLERTGVQISVTGLDHLRSFDGPCVIVGNHMSTLETFVLPGLVVPFKPLTFVVKQSLVTMPLFGPVMRSCDPVVVGRSNPRDDLRAMLNGGAERLAAGRSIAVFPQTTRTVEFDPGSFNSIGVKMARKADVPIVPLSLRTDAWSTGKLVRDIGPFRPERPVHFAFGESFKVENPKEAHGRVVAFIQDQLKGWYG